MYIKSCTFAFVAIWLFNACLAAPKADPKAEPCGGCGCGCTIERCHTVPYTAQIPIHTTHRIIPSSNCGSGCGSGWGGYGGGWGGLDGCGSWGGWGSGCGSIGWGNGLWGNGGCGCGTWGNGGWGGCGC